MIASSPPVGSRHLRHHWRASRPAKGSEPNIPLEAGRDSAFGDRYSSLLLVSRIASDVPGGLYPLEVFAYPLGVELAGYLITAG